MAEELIGRAGEMAALGRMLLEEKRTIVTLWGTAGIGKTRLAREVVRLHAPAFAGGAHFCSLAAARGPSELYATVGEELSLSSLAPQRGDDGLRRIATSLATRGRALVVLDNVEQLLESVSRALSVWTMLAPEATFLVTSRELLGVPDEAPLELSPLGMPGDDADASDSVRLLVRRATAVRPDFDAPKDVLRDLVRRLDGVPLALELAAGRLAVMSAEQLRDRLARRFDVLVTAHGGAPASRRTLRGAIDWSWDLLPETERAIFAELSVFRGGFDLEAVEAIVSPQPGAPVYGSVSALRHKSLIAVLPSELQASPYLDSDSPRFLLLESIRDYAAEKLGDRAIGVRDRHAAYFVEQARVRVATAEKEPHAAREWLSRERDNLIAVTDHFLAHPSAERAHAALSLLVPLEPLFAVRGSSAVLVDVGERVLAASERFEVDPLVRMRALEACGVASFGVAELQGAFTKLSRARLLADGDLATLTDKARIGQELGMVLQAQGSVREALALAHTSLARAEQAGARRVEGHCLGAIGGCNLMLGDYELCRRYLERSLAVLREAGAVIEQARAGARLSFALQNVGEGAAALAQIDDALALLSDAKTGRAVEGMLLGYRGNVLRERGDGALAHAHYRRAIELLSLAGDRRYAAAFRMDDAILHELEGHFDVAALQLAQALAVAQEIGDPTLCAIMAGYLATARAAQGQYDAADAASIRVERTDDAGACRSLELHAAHCALLMEQRSQARCAGSKPSDSTKLRALLGRARVLLHSLASGTGSEHPRLAGRLLARTVEALCPGADTFVVAPSRDRVRLPEGGWIDLSSRPAMQRVVSALVDARLRAPGEAQPIHRLVEAGWPGERLLPRAAANRLRVLLTSLRAQGMRDLIQSTREGYLLCPTVPVVETNPLEDEERSSGSDSGCAGRKNEEGTD